jgi:hypothetical protein
MKPFLPQEGLIIETTVNLECTSYIQSTGLWILRPLVSFSHSMMDRGLCSADPAGVARSSEKQHRELESPKPAPGRHPCREPCHESVQSLKGQNFRIK